MKRAATRRLVHQAECDSGRKELRREDEDNNTYDAEALNSDAAGDVNDGIWFMDVSGTAPKDSKGTSFGRLWRAPVREQPHSVLGQKHLNEEWPCAPSGAPRSRPPANALRSDTSSACQWTVGSR